MTHRKETQRFATISEKVRANDPLDLDDGVFLYPLPRPARGRGPRQRAPRGAARRQDLLQRHFPHQPTNVCVADCKFCSFARLEPDAPAAYTMSIDEVRQKLVERLDQPVTEIHIVNGLHHDLDFDYYKDCLRVLKQLRPDIPHQGLHRGRDSLHRAEVWAATSKC